MHIFVKGAAIAFFSLAITACSSNPDDGFTGKESADVLYSDARTAMETGNFAKAARTLEQLDSRFPFGAYKDQVQLDLIYAYYKQDSTADALANIDKFLKLNPTHPDIDYVIYMRGLVNMQADSYFLHDLLNIDRTDRDPQNAQEAFKDFNRLLKSYPNSKYAPDAQKRMQFLKDRLASYSVKVAEYYIKIDAWSAAAVRGQTIVETFSDTPYVERALEIMVQAYGELGQNTLKQHALEVMKTNFPNNALVSQR
ncbi:outer membrane protein assembly factor BamD [Shewanella sp. C32]|uniref:Outer membrane protein assembly factor BamD n=1 Tax=Shewanella electrica TaxID=515560 RepID=A0ABT2FTV7_9GAMM|nr:outer membrane protein assembly factor BamD [Shewanella electrica]MCH1927060.1 outer membrane protein assembly factor BamD [Shewanella electrica]MCS4558664.1 outer membrane protein assembly factor BamD [Shewanella electrica]